MTSANDPSIDRLMAHAAFARALARGLLRDESAADDVVQDTYVIALERPPERNARAWFATVARHLSLNALRGTRRRVAREAAAPVAETPPSPADIAAHRDTLRSVFEAVLALEEPFQSTVLLRFYEDLTPAEIAVRLGVPAATVRTRLHRAMGHLRERLDDEHDGDRRAWCVALAPVAGVARRSPVPTVTAAAVGGALVMKKLLVACALALLVALASWTLTRPGVGSESGTSQVDAPPPVARDAGRRVSAPRPVGEGEMEAAAPPVDAAAAGAPAETGPARIAGRVIDERTGAGAAGAEVFVLPNGISEKGFATASPRTRTDSDGRFVCDDLAIGPHHVAARAPGLLVTHAHDVDAAVTGGAELRLLLLRPRTITGRVVAPADVSLDGAIVWAEIPIDRASKWTWWTNVTVEVEPGLDGTFAIGGLPPIQFDVVARVRARRLSAGAKAVEAGGPAVVLTLEESGGPVHRYRLRVLGPDGRPVAWAKVRRYILHWAGSSQDGEQESKDGLLDVELPESVRCLWYEVFRYRDEAGRVVAAAPRRVRLSLPDDLEKTVRLEPPAALAGRVRDAAGAGVAGAHVSATSSEPAMDAGLGQGYAHGEATTEADGAFTIDGLAPIEYTLSVEAPPQFVEPPDVRARPGETADVALRAARQPVVTVLDAESQPIEGVDVRLFVGDDERVASATTGADGRARLDSVEPGRKFRLRLSANDDRFATLAVPDWDPIDATFRLPSALTLRGTVVSPDGTPVPAVRVFLRRADGERGEQYEDTNERGVFLFERLAPGDLQLAVTIDREDPAAEAPRSAARAGDRSVVLTVDPGLVLRAKIENWGDRDSSLLLGSPEFVEDGAAPAVSHTGRHRGDRLTFTGLPAGRTGTIVFGPLDGGFLVLRPGVSTDAGTVSVSLDRGATFSGRVVFPEGVSPHAVVPQVQIEVRGIAIGCEARAGRWSVAGIPEGTWPVRATLRLGGRTFEASTTTSPGVAADLELRETR